nr:MAG TPA: hypothetical protein [Caudoviricetes sp.]
MYSLQPCAPCSEPAVSSAKRVPNRCCRRHVLPSDLVLGPMRRRLPRACSIPIA